MNSLEKVLRAIDDIIGTSEVQGLSLFGIQMSCSNKRTRLEPTYRGLSSNTMLGNTVI